MNTASPRTDAIHQTLNRPRWLAPAKINLALHVTGRRADGSNLIARARDALRIACRDHPAPPVAITLEKNLPIASGIGGGSSDAAAALLALAAHWNAPVDAQALAALGAGLGADVPMCLAARPLVARGAGEDLQPLDRWPALHLVLANPGVALSTAHVFSLLAHRENPPLPPLPTEPDHGAVRQWLRETRNDLQLAALALAPAIGEALAALEASGAAFARMSGSGATCFGLYESAAAAHNAARGIAAAEPGWFVAATRTGGGGIDAN